MNQKLGIGKLEISGMKTQVGKIGDSLRVPHFLKMR